MRILHVTDWYLPRLGGIEMHVHDLVSEQRSRGYDASVLTTTADGPAPDDVPVTRLAGLRGLPAWSALPQVPDLIARGHHDVVHAHVSLLSPLAWSAIRAAATAGSPVVATMHSILPRSGPAGRLLTLAGNAASQQVEWTAVSAAAAEPLRRILNGHHVAVLPNGIDPDRWRTSPRPAAGRPLTLVSVMRLCERKRPLALLAMLAEIRRQVPAGQALRAVIVGSGPQASTVRRALVAHGLDNWVDLPGTLARPQIHELLEASDIYLAPATLESFGIAALEARCAGLAVVAMAGSGVGEFVSHGLEGYLVSSDGDMCDAAARLLTSPELLRAIQQHNRTSVPEMTWDHVLSRSLDAYANAAALSSGRPDTSTAGADGPRFSVVIPAYNEAGFIGDCLESLSRQDFTGGYEVIVVDNNSSDRTSEIARAHGATVLREEQAGVCSARQCGTLAARGEIVVSTDADTRFDPAWLSRIDRAFGADPSRAAVAGPCRYLDGPWWGTVYARLLFDFVHLVNRMTGRVVYVTATNLAFRKSTWSGYDTRSTQGGDELDLLRQLRSRGSVAFVSRNPTYTSARRLNQGLAYNLVVSCFFYYFLAHGLNRLFARTVIGTAPAFRGTEGPGPARQRVGHVLAGAALATLFAGFGILMIYFLEAP